MSEGSDQILRLLWSYLRQARHLPTDKISSGGSKQFPVLLMGHYNHSISVDVKV